MNIKYKFALLLILATVYFPAFSQEKHSDVASKDRFIKSLIAQMTIDEKIGQLNLPPYGDITTGLPMTLDIETLIENGEVGGLFNIRGAEKIRRMQEIAVNKSRLGIPLLIGMDVVHGYETIFPIPLAMSCSWDMHAIEQAAHISAKEASATGVNWTFSPMVDISRDPRWGRMAEGAGEDPYLGASVAKAMVEGYQGDLSADDNILACVKHFALYGAVEAGRDYNTVDMSRYRMYNEYFLPYKAAVDAGAASVMSSFNLVDGLHATANKWLLTDVLRSQWGFNGFLVTDYNSIIEMTCHGFGTGYECAVASLNAGTDMDMVSRQFKDNLKAALDKGDVAIGDIDKAVYRILDAKYKLGLFANPYKYNDVKKEQTEIYTKSNRDAARSLAASSFVLLKNDNNILPLSRKGKIALIGPLANTGANMVGTWSVTAAHSKYKSLLQGFRDAVGKKAEILYAKGSNIVSDEHQENGATPGPLNIRDSRSEEEMLREAVKVARQADVIVAALGEGPEHSGEGSCRSELELPQTQMELLKALLCVGKPVVLLNFSGRPTVMTWESKNVPAILNVWFGGSEAADAIADVVFGDVNPSGRLTASMPYNVGQIPVYYNHLMTGRPKWNDNGLYQSYTSNYFEIPNHPLYPFGYGLSYTTFEYGAPKLSSDQISDNGEITVSVDVTNTGNRFGQEVVQMYIRDLVRSIAPPVKELKGFEKISLNPGETQSVTFTITPETLKFYNHDLDFVAEPGEFEVSVGRNSDDVASEKFTYTTSIAHNPINEGWYADPEAVIYGDRYWIYPTSSLPFDDQTYLDAFSSADLVNWTKHPNILTSADVKWAKRAIWAPSAIEKDGKYYLFFSANDVHPGEIGGIGVAVADRPEWPYTDLIGKPLINDIVMGAQPIDQFVFRNDDGRYYMYYGGWGHCVLVALADDFKSLVPLHDGSMCKEATPENYTEGPFMFKRNGKYYFMWSEGNWTMANYYVNYAVSDSPFGPFNSKGRILEADGILGTGAGHHSVINIPGADEYYIVYHMHPADDNDGNHRQIYIDKMEFDDNGNILPVKITKEGVESRPLTENDVALTCNNSNSK